MNRKNQESEILIDMDDFDFSSSTYEELTDTWWAIWAALEVNENSWKKSLHNTAFCALLKQCGWTLDDWNDETAWRKCKKDNSKSNDE